jgi:hypothetical protein
MPLSFEYGSKTLQEFIHLYDNGQLNLEPGFQRNSVWTTNDRRKLIESVCTSRPVPSVFLYRSKDKHGRLKYDVIDGKQRLESVLFFTGASGFRGDRFDVLFALPGAAESEWYDWRWLQKKGHESLVTGYKVQTVEVSGDLADIIDLFVRINSTGKRLTNAEKRHAKYYHSAFLRLAGRIAERRRQFFLENRVMSAGLISRMKHVEFVSELMASILSRGPINKKTALDSIIGGQTLPMRDLARSEHEFTHTLNRLMKMFPRLRETRFKNSVDLYTLFMLMWDLDQNGAILTDRKRNRQAEQLLIWLSGGVDAVRDQIRKAKGAQPDQQMFADYVLTIQGDTDSLATRQRRAALVRQLLGGIFERKDEKRGFTAEQRRLIWNIDVDKRCRGCNDRLSWTNFTIDHVKPHSLGGRSSRQNAALLCRSCNSRKGNRRTRRRAA